MLACTGFYTSRSLQRICYTVCWPRPAVQVLMELVNAFIDCVGKCERIFKTPIPAAYTR